MIRMIRVLTFVAASLVMLIGVAGIIGFTLPRHYHVTSHAFYHARQDSVWAVVADIERSPQWRTGLAGVKRLPDRGGHAVWQQESKAGPWPLELTQITPPDTLVAAAADTTQGYGGAWTFTLAAERGGTRVTIAEAGFVDNPMLRFLAHFVFGLRTGQQQYLRDLGRRLGEVVEVAEG
jgi:hypothetical protein